MPTGLRLLPAWARPAEFPLSRHRRGERVIAAGRVVLAGFSLLAVGLYTGAEGDRSELVALALGIYLAYAVLYAAAAWYVWRLPLWLRPATHVFDLLWFSLLCLLSGDAASPLFVFFVFGLVSATIRWRWRGTLWTALAALIAYTAIGLYTANVPGAPPLALDRFLIRLINLLVAAVLLGYLGRHQQQIEFELARLAGWPRAVPAELRQLLTTALEQAAGILAAERACLVWQEPEEPEVHLAIWAGGELNWRGHPPGRLEPWVPEPLAGKEFLCTGRGDDAICVYEEAGELRSRRGRPLGAALLERLGFRNALCLPLASESVEGLLVVCDRPGSGPDDLVTGRLVARILASQLDQLALTRSLEREAADAERLRLGRDLHDGVTQSLAASGMQLEALGRLIAAAPAEASRRLAEVQRQLESDQRELREFAHRTRAAADSSRALSRRLRDLANRVERSWGVAVALEVGAGLDRRLPSGFAHHVYHLAQEALFNAARHSGATRVELTIGGESEELMMVAADNGRGFAFVGTRDLAELERLGEGPVSIRERVTQLGGGMILESRPSGARIELRFQLPHGGGLDFDSPGAGR